VILWLRKQDNNCDFPAVLCAITKPQAVQKMFKIGKTKISIKAEGCVKCGVQWSSGWKVFEEVPVKVGNLCGVQWSSGWKVFEEVPVKVGNLKEKFLTISICQDCSISAVRLRSDSTEKL